MMKRLLRIMLIMSVLSAAHGALYGGWLSGAGLSGAEAHAATIQLPASGQNTCYDTAGATIACSGTGQDGDKKVGVTWDDATRFTNNSNGTITDNLSGLIWLQNANCIETVGGVAKASGYPTWADALTWSNNLATGKCGLTDGSSAGQWRLPTRKEQKSLVNRGQANNAAWLGTKGFSGVLTVYYWSSSTYAYDSSSAWYVYMSDGYVYVDGKTNGYYVWPVRSGQ